MLLAGTTMLLLLAATLTVGPAMAQEDDRGEKEKARPDHKKHRNGTFVLGFGVAIEDDKVYRSKLRLGLMKSDVENTYAVKKGGIVINDERSPVRYEVIADTWTVEVREDGHAFIASGQVEDRDGNAYDVALEGDLLGKTDHGRLYMVKGKFSGESEEYSLHYFAFLKDEVNIDRENVQESG